MNVSQDVSKMLLPIKLVWLALIASMLVYFIVLFYMGIKDTVDVNEVGGFKTILFSMAFLPFIFTFVFSRRLYFIIGKVNISNAPFAKGMNEEDQKVLAEFPGYFVVHIIMWALNESGAIFGFVLSIMTGNIQYYAILASIAIVFNLFLLKPNYLKFIQERRRFE